MLHEEKETHHFPLLDLAYQQKSDQCRRLILAEIELAH